MRHEKAGRLLELARMLASTAEGLTLDDIAERLGVGRRTAERMRDAVRDVFPQLEEVEDPPTRRFRIPAGLDGLFQAPTAEELAALAAAGEVFELGAGDVVVFQGDRRHSYRNPGREPAVGYSVVLLAGPTP